MKSSLPEYMVEAAMWIQELRIAATDCRPKEKDENNKGKADEEEEARVPVEEQQKEATTVDAASTVQGGKERERGTSVEGRQRKLKEDEGKEMSEERDVRSRVYWQVVGERLEQVTIHRQAKSSTISAYRLTNEAAIEVFADQTIPYSLWELRWRAFHQVLKVGETQPWLGRAQKKCKRPECRGRPGGPPEESIAHYVKHCPAARRLWEEVAKKLRWPALTTQSWEAIVSGLQPAADTGSHPGIAKAAHNRPHGPVPWSVVRLTNLYVLLALGLHKAKELRLTGGRQAPASPWADFVCSRLKESAIWERDHQKQGKGAIGKERWQRRWTWLMGYPTPIT